jgi:hypothetical protein
MSGPFADILADWVGNDSMQRMRYRRKSGTRRYRSEDSERRAFLDRIGGCRFPCGGGNVGHRADGRHRTAFDAIGRAARLNDAVAVRKNIAAIATSKRFDTYWNATIVHITQAILKTHAMDLPAALTVTIGIASATVIPAYQTIVNSCNGNRPRDPEVPDTCRQVSILMLGGDTYLTEMIGIVIAKQAWPEGSPEYADAVMAKRIVRYRMAKDEDLHRGFSAAERLRLMSEKKTEQEVDVAELLDAGLNPNPPADWADKRSGT